MTQDSCSINVDKCSKCGRSLYWYGKEYNGDIISFGWHRADYAKNSYIINLCNNCCKKHLQNIDKKENKF